MTMVVKDPDARIDYEFIWGAAYPDGQAVTTSAWTCVPDEAGGVAVAAAGPAFAGGLSFGFHGRRPSPASGACVIRRPAAGARVALCGATAGASIVSWAYTSAAGQVVRSMDAIRSRVTAVRFSIGRFFPSQEQYQLLTDD